MAFWAKSRHDCVISGTLGGLAERWGWNPTALRIGYSIFTVLTGFIPLILIYILLALIMD